MDEEITKETYANAYAEVLEIIDSLSEEAYKKIPEEVIKSFEDKANMDYEFEYDPNTPFEKQNFLEITKYILAQLFIDYLANDEQKAKLKQKKQYFIQQKEKDAQELYNPNNLFKKKDDTPEETQVIVYKESFFNKLFIKIKSFFKR